MTSRRMSATMCRISHCARQQSRRSAMCRSSVKFTITWKLVGVALGRTKRASSAGMPFASASSYTRVISRMSRSYSSAIPCTSRQVFGMT